MALQVVLPSPFDVQPAPPMRTRHIRNERRLQRLLVSHGCCDSAAVLDEVAAQLANESFAFLDNFSATDALRQEMDEALQVGMHGRVGGAESSGGSLSFIRGDTTRWALEAPHGSLPSLPPLLRRVDSLVAQLSSRLPDLADVRWRSDTQLAAFAHDGARYIRHVDNTCARGAGKLCNGRRLTAILYLNPAWSDDLGGRLRLYRRREGAEVPEVDLAPADGRLLLFYSDERSPHEVLPVAAGARRRALTVWYLSASEVAGAATHLRESMRLLPLELEH